MRKKKFVTMHGHVNVECTIKCFLSVSQTSTVTRITNTLSAVCDKVGRLPGLSAVSQAATMPCRLQLCAVLWGGRKPS